MQNIPTFLQGIQKQSYDPTAEVNKPFLQPSPTEQKIKQIATQNQPKAQERKTSFTPDEFVNSVDTFIANNPGITEDEALDFVENHYKEKGFTVEGMEFSQPVEPVEEEKTIVEDIKTGGENLVGGAVSNIPNIIGNTFGFLADVVTPKEMEGLGDFFRESGIRDKQGLQEVLGVDPDAFLTQAGEFGSEIGVLMTPTGAAGGVAKLGEKAPALVKGLQTLASKTDKVPNILKTLGKSSAKGATEVGKLEVVSEGEVTPEGLAIGAVANPVIGTTIKGIGKITKPVAEKLEVMGLLNPAKLKIVTDQLKTEGVENVSVAEHLLKNKVKGTKEQIVKQLDDLANISKNEVDKAIGKVSGTFKNEGVDGILTQVRKDFADVPGQEQVINRAKELFTKSTKGEGLTLKEVQEVKRMADKHLNLFTVVGDPRAGAVKQGLVNLRGQIQKFIEDTAKKNGVSNIKQLNKNTQVNRTLIDAIERKESADQVRELLSAFSTSGVGAGLGGVGAISQGQDPMQVLKSIIIGGTIGGVAGSTKIKTNVANILNKLTPTERKGIIDFIDSNGAKPINTSIIEKIKGIIPNEEE